MIYLYTQKQENDDWILQNDWYFNLYTGNQPFTEEEKQIVERIDGARITDDMHIVTKYGLGTIRNLSTGCKTYLMPTILPVERSSSFPCAAMSPSTLPEMITCCAR